MDEFLRQIALMFPGFEKYFSAGFIVFARLLGFIRFARLITGGQNVRESHVNLAHVSRGYANRGRAVLPFLARHVIIRVGKCIVRHVHHLRTVSIRHRHEIATLGSVFGQDDVAPALQCRHVSVKRGNVHAVARVKILEGTVAAVHGVEQRDVFTLGLGEIQHPVAVSSADQLKVCGEKISELALVFFVHDLGLLDQIKEHFGRAFARLADGLLVAEFAVKI